MKHHVHKAVYGDEAYLRCRLSYHRDGKLEVIKPFVVVVGDDFYLFRNSYSQLLKASDELVTDIGGGAEHPVGMNGLHKLAD